MAFVSKNFWSQKIRSSTNLCLNSFCYDYKSTEGTNARVAAGNGKVGQIENLGTRQTAGFHIKVSSHMNILSVKKNDNKTHFKELGCTG